MSDDPKQPSGGGEVSQEDIDALLGGGQPPGGAGAEASAPTSPSAPAPPSSGGEISQAEVDVLTQAAGSGDAPAAETGSAPSTPDAGAADQRVDSLGKPFDDVAAAMQAAIEEEQSPAAATAGQTEEVPPPPANARSLELPELGNAPLGEADPKRVTMLSDVNLGVRIELGRTRMLVEEVLRLGEGSVVELDKLAGDPVDVFANDRLVARGEVLVLNDSFCVRISEVFSRDPHRVVQ